MPAADQREVTIFLPYEPERSESRKPLLAEEFEIVIEVQRNRVEWLMRPLSRPRQDPPKGKAVHDETLASGVVDAVCVQWVAEDGFVQTVWRHSSMRPGPPDSRSNPQGGART
jgi:hypothetical protein